MGRIGRPERRKLTTNLRRVTSQKSKDLIYIAIWKQHCDEIIPQSKNNRLADYLKRAFISKCY